MRKNRQKNKQIIVFIMFFVLFFISSACQSREKTYGVPLDTSKGQIVAMQTILASPAKYEGKNVIVQGKVGQVCLSSGCWILLVDGANQLFVQFYNFTAQPAPQTPIRVQGVLKMQNGTPLLATTGMEIVK